MNTEEVKAESKAPQTLDDLDFISESLDHIMSHPAAGPLRPQIEADFKIAYGNFLEQPVNPMANESEIMNARIFKTDLFMAFVTGIIWAGMPTGNFYNALQAAAVKEEQGKSPLIYTP